MKQTYLKATTALLFCGASVMAQPVLNASGINPVIAETMTLNYGNYVSPGSAGANQTWNLSTITPSSTSQLTVGTVASTPYAATFAASSNIQSNDGTTYGFMNNSNSVMALTGAVAGGQTFVNSNSEEVLHYPFQMSDTYTDAFASSYTISSIPFARSGSVTVTYDGYGTLITPAGTFSNVARVHFVETYTDVSTFGNISYHNDEYMWYANGYHNALAAVINLTNSVAAPTQTGVYLTVVSSTVGISEQSFAGNLISYPNPAADKVHFSQRNQDPIVSVELFDLSGHMVGTVVNEVGLSTVSLDLTAVSSGMYLAKMSTQSGAVETRKISVKK